MKIKIYRLPSGFANVPDKCSFDPIDHERATYDTIEIPNSYQIYTNIFDETAVKDEKGNFLIPNYVWRRNGVSCKPYIMLSYCSSEYGGGVHHFEILD